MRLPVPIPVVQLCMLLWVLMGITLALAVHNLTV
jgi:hypothetical protein